VTRQPTTGITEDLRLRSHATPPPCKARDRPVSSLGAFSLRSDPMHSRRAMRLASAGPRLPSKMHAPCCAWPGSLLAPARCSPRLAARPGSLLAPARCSPRLAARPGSLLAPARCSPPLPARPGSLLATAPYSPRLAALPGSLLAPARCSPPLRACPCSLLAPAPCSPPLPARPCSLLARAPCSPRLAAGPGSLLTPARCSPPLPARPRSLLAPARCSPRLAARPCSLLAPAPCVPCIAQFSLLSTLASDAAMRAAGMQANDALLRFRKARCSQPLIADEPQLVVPSSGGVGCGTPRLRRLWPTGVAFGSLLGPTLAPPLPKGLLMAATPSPTPSGVSDGESAAALPRAQTPATTLALCHHHDRVHLQKWPRRYPPCKHCRAELCCALMFCVSSTPRLTYSRRRSSVGRIIQLQRQLPSTPPPTTLSAFMWRRPRTQKPPSLEQRMRMMNWRRWWPGPRQQSRRHQPLGPESNVSVLCLLWSEPVACRGW